MEDAHIIDCFDDTLPDHTLLCILDGHAGANTALLISTRLTDIVAATAQFKEYAELYNREKEQWLSKKSAISSSSSGKKRNRKQAASSDSNEADADVYTNTPEQLDLLSAALVQAYIDADEELLQMIRAEQDRAEKLGHVSQQEEGAIGISGSTCVTSIVTPSHVLCANVGDSRCVLATGGTCVSLSEDHKPSLPEELERIEAAGCFEAHDRVNGELAMSRALGDFQYKELSLPVSQQAVTCIPDVAVQPRNRDPITGDEVLVLACDGVWDVMSNPDSLTFIKDVVMNSDSSCLMEEAAGALISLALTQGSMDNISAIVVNFNPVNRSSD